MIIARTRALYRCSFSLGSGTLSEAMGQAGCARPFRTGRIGMVIALHLIILSPFDDSPCLEGAGVLSAFTSQRRHLHPDLLQNAARCTARHDFRMDHHDLVPA